LGSKENSLSHWAGCQGILAECNAIKEWGKKVLIFKVYLLWLANAFAFAFAFIL